MQVTLAELAVLVEGQLCGEGSLAITGAAPLTDVAAGQITLVDGAHKNESLAGSPAAAAVAPRSFEPNGLPVILVDDVHQAFTRILHRFRPPRPVRRMGISPLAVVSPTACIAADVEIHPHAVVGDDVEIGAGSSIHAGVQIMAGSKIGPQVTIFPNAVLYEDTIVGPRSIIHGGAVLGAYGFGYQVVQGRHCLLAQLGNVILGADVEIGANTTIDRGTYGPTVIGEGTKIDNQVQVGHNCHIGRHNILCAQVGIAGSTSTGDYVVMAGQVGVKDHVHIGQGAMLGGMSGIMRDVPDGARFVGIPATPEREQGVIQLAISKLPEMRKQLKALENTVAKLAPAPIPAPNP